MVEYLYLNSGKGLFKVAASSKLTKHAVTPLSWGSILTFEEPELGHVSVYAACRSIHLCARKESAFQLVLFLLLCSLWLVLLCPSWGEHRSVDGWIATIWKISNDADVHASSSFFVSLFLFQGSHPRLLLQPSSGTHVKTNIGKEITRGIPESVAAERRRY